VPQNYINTMPNINNIELIIENEAVAIPPLPRLPTTLGSGLVPGCWAPEQASVNAPRMTSDWSFARAELHGLMELSKHETIVRRALENMIMNVIYNYVDTLHTFIVHTS
jgi:hypothetical protein